MFLVIDVLLNVQYGNLSATIRATDEAKLGLVQSTFGLAVLLQIGVASFVAWRAPALKMAHALLAAFISGCLSTVAWHVVNLGYGGTIDASFVVTSYVQMVCVGGLLAVIVAGPVAALTSCSRLVADAGLVAVHSRIS